MTTMNSLYGDGSDHPACPICEKCIKCNDCECTVESIRAQLTALQAKLAEFEEDFEQSYISLAIEGVRPNSLHEGIALLRAKLQTVEEANAHLRSENARINERANDEAELNGTLMAKLEAAEKDAARYKAIRMLPFEAIKSIFWDLLPDSEKVYRAAVRDERVDSAIAQNGKESFDQSEWKENKLPIAERNRAKE